MEEITPDEKKSEPRSEEKLNKEFVEKRKSQLMKQRKMTVKQVTGLLKVNMENLRTDCVKIERNDYGKFDNFYRFYDPGTSEAWFYFPVDDLSTVKSANLYLDHCSTSSNGSVAIFLNEKLFIAKHTTTKYHFQKQQFEIPTELLEKGENKVSVILHRDTDGPYCLSSAEVELEFEIKVPKKRKVHFRPS